MLTFSLLLGRAVAAEFHTVDAHIELDGKASVSIILFGEIEKGDSQKLNDAVNVLNEKGIVVGLLYLYSPGGSLSEGLAIGRMARSKLIATKAPSVIEEGRFCPSERQLFGEFDLENPWNSHFTSNDHPNCICASACALAWLGGVNRYGQVGFHHASIPEGNQHSSFDEFSKRLDESRPMISKYLDEMRAPLFVQDAIFSTGSNEIKFFDSQRVKELDSDPLYREFLLAQCPRHDPVTDLACVMSVSHAQQRAVQLGE